MPAARRRNGDIPEAPTTADGASSPLVKPIMTEDRGSRAHAVQSRDGGRRPWNSRRTVLLRPSRTTPY